MSSSRTKLGIPWYINMYRDEEYWGDTGDHGYRN